MTTSGGSPWRDEYWWEHRAADAESAGDLRERAEEEAAQRRAIGEEFGIPDPVKMQAQVDAICATRLGEGSDSS